ncbi:MAG: hypothetical protein KJ976_10125 [Proteobacteria bacterium]|nr:hypothetical protein [Pseudomonadota bacterium]MBU4415445.1 hypothetical protein [Pseudomonadota bacterium]
MNKVNPKDKISQARQKLSVLNKERAKSIFSLIHGKPMVLGLPHYVYRRCGNKNCKCAKGHKHGPYLALSVNKDGGQKIVMVKKVDALTVREESRRYKNYQETLAKIRRINKEIDEILDELKKITTRNYP